MTGLQLLLIQWNSTLLHYGWACREIALKLKTRPIQTQSIIQPDELCGREPKNVSL